MGGAAVDTSRLEDSGAVLAAAVDKLGGLLATSNEQGAVSVWRSGSGRDELWQRVSTWQTETGSPELVAWAQPATGRILAVADTSGEVTIWQGTQQSLSSSDNRHPMHFQQTSVLGDSHDPIACMEFGPRDQGLWLAVASDDGHVRVYAATSPLLPEAFELEGSFVAAAQGTCTCLAWRPGPLQPSPLLLAVGTSSGAQIWAYHADIMDWGHVGAVGRSSEAVSAIAWAEPLGRPAELLAVASGSQIEILALKGPADSMQADTIAKLKAEGTVWRLRWDPWGLQLAASSDACQIQVWKANMLGEWMPTAKVIGGASEMLPAELSDEE